MTIAITGSTGHLGTLVIDALLARGVEPAGIVALARDLERAVPLAEKGVTVRHFDYSQPDSLASELDDVTDLLLISGNAIGQRFAQHSAVIDAAVNAGVRRVVYTSVDTASTPIEESVNPVSPEHAQTEAYLSQAEVASVILRNGWYNENQVAALQSAQQSGTVLSSAGTGRIASAARKDYAEAAAAVLLDPDAKPLYQLNGDVAWSVDDLAAALSTVLSTDISVQQVSGEEQLKILTAAGLDDGMAHFVVGVDAATAAGELGATTGELASLIGRATTPLLDTLRAAG